MTLGVVIVGAGGIAAAHVDAVLNGPELRLTGLVSRSGARAADFADRAAERQGTRPWITASAEAAFDRDDVDMVVICTESSDHAGTAIAAVEAGRHVLLEKPVATRLADARRLDAAARATRSRHPGQVVSVVSQRRFAPATLELGAAVAEGRLGRVTSAAVLMPWWRDAEYYTSSPWRGTWAGDGGGSLMNQGIHFADLLIAVLGRPAAVAGFTARIGHGRDTAHGRDLVETEDTAAAVVRFTGGALATVLTSTSAFPGSAGELRVHGTAGSALLVDDHLALTDASGTRTMDAPPDTVAADPAARSATPAGASAALSRQYADVVDAIRTARPPRAGLPEALAALALVKSVYLAESAATTLSFDEVLGGALDHRDPAVAP